MSSQAAKLLQQFDAAVRVFEVLDLEEDDAASR